MLPVIPVPSQAVPAILPLPTGAARGGIEAAWARHADEVRQAQRLRYDVFARELGARLPSLVPEHDIDRFDDYCVHPAHRHGGVILVLCSALGPPAWDPAFRTADLPMTMRTANLPPRYLRGLAGG